MKIAALQQHVNFTNALQCAGVKGFSDPETSTEYVERGPVLYAARPDSSSVFRAIRKINSRKFCIINPDGPNDAKLRAAGFRQIMTPSCVAEIDLTLPFHPKGKWRNAWQRSLKNPLTITHRPFDPVQDQWLFKADRDQQRAKKFRAMPHAIAQLWPTSDTLLSVAKVNDIPVAAMLFLHHGLATTYQIGWTNSDGRAYGAHNRIIAEAIDIMKEKLISRLDLGAVDTVNAPSLARFKIGTGAGIRTLGGTWAALPLWRR